jgi:hypothetical protein
MFTWEDQVHQLTATESGTYRHDASRESLSYSDDIWLNSIVEMGEQFSASAKSCLDFVCDQ